MDPVDALMREYGLSREEATLLQQKVDLHMQNWQSARRALGLSGGLAYQDGLSRGEDAVRAQQEEARKRRVDHYYAIDRAILLGQKVSPEDYQWYQRVQQLQAAKKLSAPLDLEIGPAKIQPPLDLEIGPAKIQPPLDLQIGPARIQPTTLPADTSAMAVQNLEAMTAAGMPSSMMYGYHRSLTRPTPSVADMAHYEQTAAPELRTLEMRPSDASMDGLTPDNEMLLESIYGPHLKAADSYGGDLPDEYFEDMKNPPSESARKNIRAGVRELQRRRRGTRT